ncbi:hypothetical protein ABL78_1815 [Leptomonas seymouri]|uniref:Methyltransferase domain-containing protein n=1 Tax=Leptomonas seymouri TaxID=5684 RepID=A0A0N0P7R1_LEPSE|nr:hypothetical protein ABL78_1815 [Leptomonas seymouri]|eukprot:KPI89079.1 hypothetical protein ABL78_1815 [Leptomonas seymouri]
MPVYHTLALPLSADYAHNSRDGFSFFVTPSGAASTASLLHPVVEGYLDDLCAFLRGARLIQSHPDNYFQFMRGETWADSAIHFDGSAVKPKELQDMQHMLSGFGPLLRGEDAMAKLRALVRDGPPPCSATPPSPPGEVPSGSPKGSDRSPLQALNEYYVRTRRLMLGRARRPNNDAAITTLTTPEAARTLDSVSEHAGAARDHKKAILDLVVAQGMHPKKQHEVRIMRDTIHNLVDCCNAGVPAQQQDHRTVGSEVEGQPVPPTAPEPSSAVRVETVINIGEGKGYVSRAVALCDNMQVIGLDCNPAHKERAVERIELLLEASLSSRDGRPRVNLLYEPRGHMASIACCVEAEVDWAALLQGHVLTSDDPHGSCSASASRTAADSAGLREVPCGGEAGSTGTRSNTDGGCVDAMTVLSRTRGVESVKVACRVCGKVVRLENTTVIMKHIYSHLHDAETSSETCPSPLMPTAEQLRQWNITLSQHAYVAKLTEAFFSASDVELRHFENRKDAALLKRTRESDVASEGDDAKNTSAPTYLTLPRVSSSTTAGAGVTHTGAAASEESSITLEPTYTARGYRAVLLVARTVSAAAATAAGEHAAPLATAARAPAAPEPEEGRGGTAAGSPSLPQTWTFEQRVATIVGYDGGTDCHQVCLDVETKKRVLRLYRIPHSSRGAPPPPLHLRLAKPPNGSSSPSPSFIGEWQLPDPAIWGRHHVAVVLTVLPPALPSTPAVYVPSVRNAVLIGLHPCGDLGSNVCRIFRSSAARGLLLVSCCWHALTPQGFPLSRAVQRHGMTTDSISLLLATQPLDAWSTASPEGHRSSAKLLFYRSLFKLLWAQLAREWMAADGRTCCINSSSGNDGSGTPCHCEFPVAAPHLQPAFLRRVSRRKETLTFAEFVGEIAAEYVYKESAKDTPYTPWNIGHHCPTCRDAQESFIRAALTVRGLPEQMAASFEGEHFAQFLGLTVLRMWMCHLVESLLLLDRTLYLHEELSACGGGGTAEGEDSAVSLVPLFDGALSPRMYGILARRGGSAYA